MVRISYFQVCRPDQAQRCSGSMECLNKTDCRSGVASLLDPAYIFYIF
jgi:hypothetical protein